MDKLKTTAPPIALQYAKLKNLQSQTMLTRLGIIDLKKQMKKEAECEAQRWEQQIDQFGECLQRQQLLFNEFASSLLASKSIPCNKLQLNAPTFFHAHTSNNNMDEGLCPLTLQEFCNRAPSQVYLFYSQGTTQNAIYKE